MLERGIEQEVKAGIANAAHQKEIDPIGFDFWPIPNNMRPGKKANGKKGNQPASEGQNHWRDMPNCEFSSNRISRPNEGGDGEKQVGIFVNWQENHSAAFF